MLEFVSRVQFSKSRPTPRSVLARSVAFQSSRSASPVASRSNSSSSTGSCAFLAASNRFDAPRCRESSGVSSVCSVPCSVRCVGSVRVSRSVAFASDEFAYVCVASAPETGAHGPKSVLSRMLAVSRRAAMRKKFSCIASRLADQKSKSRAHVASHEARSLSRTPRAREAAPNESSECEMSSVGQLKHTGPGGRPLAKNRPEFDRSVEAVNEKSVASIACVGEWRAIGDVVLEAMSACVTPNRGAAETSRAVH